MAGLIFDKAQIEQTIDAVVARTMRMDMTWDWPCGVAYYGICEAYEVTGKQEYLKLVQDVWTNTSSWACPSGPSTPARWDIASSRCMSTPATSGT